MAGDPANVRAPDRDVEGSPATPDSPAGGVARPRAAGGSSTQQLHKLDQPALRRVECRAGHGRCLTDRDRQRWSDDSRIPPPGAWCDLPVHRAGREIPRPAPDTCSAGTLRWGGAVREERPRPIILQSARIGNSVALNPGHVGVTVPDRPEAGQSIEVLGLHLEAFLPLAHPRSAG